MFHEGGLPNDNHNHQSEEGSGSARAGATQPVEVPKGPAVPSQAGEEQPTAAFELERPKTKLQQVPFLKVIARPEDYSFRKEGDEDPFSETALRSLKEGIKRHKGVHTPLLLRALDNGYFLVADGHRRYFAVKQLIAERVKGFTNGIQLPANVLQPGTSDLVMVAAAVSANFDRLAIGGEGRMDAARKLHELGMPRASIAQILHVGETTVNRDLLLANDEAMLYLIRVNHAITMTNGAALLSAAVKANPSRRDELIEFLRCWATETQEQIDAEIDERKAKDEPALPAAQKWPQSRMTSEMVRAWKEALEKAEPLADPGFRFRAAVSTATGPARVEIDAVSKKVDDLSAADVAKILVRCRDLAFELEPVMLAKAAAEKAEPSEGNATKLSPGMQRLKELGVEGLVAKAEVSKEDSEDAKEAEYDPTDSHYMDQEADAEGETPEEEAAVE